MLLDGYIYGSPAKHKLGIRISNVDSHSFNEYKIIISNNIVKCARKCDCHIRKIISKHIVDIVIRLKFTILSPEAKTFPLGARRRTGRPSKSNRPLTMQ